MIPVVMLTTSQAEEDIVRSYSLHANAFISKPVDFEHFIEAILQIDTFLPASPGQQTVTSSALSASMTLTPGCSPEFGPSPHRHRRGQIAPRDGRAALKTR